MKTVRFLPVSLLLSVAVLFGGAWLASLAAGPQEAIAEEAEVADETVAEGVSVIVTKVRNDQGKILIAVFDDADAFAEYDYDRAVGYVELPAEKGRVEARFPYLTGGPYAVSLFHDENGDYDFNMRGSTPLEGYGTSGARDAFHEPSFTVASTKKRRIPVKMYYFLSD